MSNIEATEAESHMRAIVSLLDALASKSVVLYAHRYDYLSFGSWVLVVGQRKHRYQFAWDGKESYLSVADSPFPDSQSAANWSEIPQHAGPASSADVFDKIRAILVATYAA